MPQRGHWICDSLSKLAIPEFDKHKHPVTAAPTAVQAIALQRIAAALARAGNPDLDLSVSSCVNDMLKGQSLYEEMPSNLCLYDPAKLKILRTQLKPQPLDKRLSPHAKTTFQRF